MSGAHCAEYIMSKEKQVLSAIHNGTWNAVPGFAAKHPQLRSAQGQYSCALQIGKFDILRFQKIPKSTAVLERMWIGVIPSPNFKRVRIATTPGSTKDTWTADECPPPCFCKWTSTDDATSADDKSRREVVCLQNQTTIKVVNDFNSQVIST